MLKWDEGKNTVSIRNRQTVERETGPSLKWDEGKKTVSAVTDKQPKEKPSPC